MFSCSWAGSLSILNNIMEKYVNTDVCLHQLPPSPLYASLPRKWTRCLILALAQAVTRPSLGRSLNGTQAVDPSSHNLMFVKVPEQTSTEQLRVNDVWGDGHREGENEVFKFPMKTSPAANLQNRSVSRSLSGEFFHVLGENSLIRLVIVANIKKVKIL